jgi:hypothetical protein
MAVTIAMVSKNMCMTRRWKDKHVGCRIRVQTSPEFALLVALNLRIRLYGQSVQKMFSILSCLQKPIAVKPRIGIHRMSNQRKAELVNGKFGIQSFWGGRGKILSKI